MARKPRLHVPGGVYHVMLRGNGGQDIFFAKADRRRFLDLLAEGVRFSARRSTTKAARSSRRSQTFRPKTDARSVTSQHPRILANSTKVLPGTWGVALHP